MEKQITVEVAYATPDQQKIIVLTVAEGTNAREAARRADLPRWFSGLDVSSSALGIFGNALGARGMPDPEEYILKDGDRVEIYRPLIADPKAVRKQRAEQAASKRANLKTS